jgi:hypothetical protein
MDTGRPSADEGDVRGERVINTEERLLLFHRQVFPQVGMNILSCHFSFVMRAT